MAYFDAPYRPADLTVDSSHSLVSGMQAWFPLTQGSGTVAQCILHPSHTGTLGSGVTWETSERGTVAVFDGTSNAKINFSSQLVSGQTLSFSVWLYVASSVAGRRTIYCDGQSFVQNDFRYDGNGKRFVFDHYTPSGEPNKTSTDYGIDDRWIHVVVTQDSSTTKIYYDGVLKNTGTAETYASSAPTAFNIGSRDGSDSFDGKMQNFQAWNRVITADEVALLHARPWTASNYDTEALWLSPPASPVLSTAPEATSIMANCVGWWPLTQGSGSTATDLVGSNDGTLTSGISWANGSLGNASEHPSSASEYISTGLDLAGKSAVTVSAWIRNDGSNSGASYGKIVTQSHGGNFDSYISKASNTDLKFHINATTLAASQSDIPTRGDWFHVCFLWEQSLRQEFYINGKLSNSTTANSSVIGSTTHDVFIGGTSAATRPWDGGIQNVRIWDRALSSDEVAVLTERPWIGAEYNETAPLYPPVPSNLTPLDSSSINTDQELWLPLTDGTGTTAVDISGGGNDGTVTNATWRNSELGTALEIDATGEYVQSSIASTVFDSRFTVATWLEMDGFSGSSTTPIFSVESDYQGGNYTNGSYIALGLKNSGTQVHLHNGNGIGPTQVIDVLDGRWHLFILDYNPTDGSYNLYLDGVLSATGTRTKFRSPTGSIRFFGGGFHSANSYVTGGQNVRVWSRALSATEVADIYYSPWLGSAYPSTGGGTPSYFVAAQFNRLGIGPRFRRL